VFIKIDCINIRSSNPYVAVLGVSSLNLQEYTFTLLTLIQIILAVVIQVLIALVLSALPFVLGDISEPFANNKIKKAICRINRIRIDSVLATAADFQTVTGIL